MTPAASMSELIAALEKATGPDRELDRLIGESVGANMGLSGDAIGLGYAPYTASIDAALTLLKAGSEYEITTLCGIARVTVDMNHGDDGQPYYGEHKGGSVPIALCIASLRARECP